MRKFWRSRRILLYRRRFAGRGEPATLLEFRIFARCGTFPSCDHVTVTVLDIKELLTQTWMT